MSPRQRPALCLFSQTSRLIAHRSDPRRDRRRLPKAAPTQQSPPTQPGPTKPNQANATRSNLSLPYPIKPNPLNQGAARAVVAEIKKLRQQAMKNRQLAPASSGSRRRTGEGSANDARTREGSSNGGDEDRALSRGAAGATAAGSGKEVPPAAVDHPEAWEWYLKAAACG